MEIVLVTVAVVVACAAAVLVYRTASGAGSIRRAFAGVPPTTAGSVAEPGVLRLAGVARAIGEAPISEASGRPYVARELRIVESSGDSGSTRPARNAVDFLLDDGTGVALVRARDALFAIARDFEAPPTTLDRIPWVDALLRAGGYRNGSPSTCRIRVYEGVLPPGARVAVVGRVEPADASARALGATVVVRPDGAARVALRAVATNDEG